MTCSGACSRTGAKFQMARMPPATIKSATACASAAGTVMMPIRMCIRWARFGSLSSGRTCLPWICVPIFDGIEVKGGHDLQAALLKFAVAQQRRTHAAGPDEKGVVDVIPAEKPLQFLNHIRQHIADARPADDADRFQILAHLRRIQVQIQPDVRAGNRLVPGRLPLLEEAMIQRQPLQGRLRDDLSKASHPGV